MERRLGRMIRSMSLSGMVRFTANGGGWAPSVDVFETGDSVLVYMDIAGVDVGDLAITVDRDRLTVSGERQFAMTDVCCVHHLEIEYGPFQRTVKLPVAVDVDKATSSCRNGMLVVRLPKLQPTGKITIEVS